MKHRCPRSLRIRFPADIVLLSKADLAGEAGVEKARAVIDRGPRKLPILPMTEGVIDPA